MFKTLVPVMIAAAVAGSTPLVSVADDAPTARVEVSNGKLLDARKIIVPTVVLNLSVDGTAWAMKRNGSPNAQAKGAFVVSGLEKQFVQDLAIKVHQDLVDRLRVAGFTVLTYDDIKDDPQAAKLNRHEVDSDYGLPYRDDESTPVNHLIATPSDAQAFKPPIQGPHWAFKGIAKDRNAVVIIPEFWISAPQMWGEKESGAKRASAGINIAPGMNVSGAFAWFINPKAACGLIKLKGTMRNVAEEVGTLTSIGKDKTDRGFAKRVKAAWSMTIDPTSYSAGVLRGTAAFHEAVTEVCTKEKSNRSASSP